MNDVRFFPDGWEDYLYWQEQDRKTLRRINQIIRDIQRDPTGGIGKAEALKYDYAGWLSRRIDGTNRLVYKIEDGVVVIAECRSHYAK